MKNCYLNTRQFFLFISIQIFFICLCSGQTFTEQLKEQLSGKRVDKTKAIYPIADKTFWNAFTSDNKAQGWSLQGVVTYEQEWAGADQRLKFTNYLTHPAQAWVEQGMYQTFIQLNELHFSNNTDFWFSNFVCSMRYPGYENNATSSDMFQSNSCGLRLLDTLDNSRYSDVRSEYRCHNLWTRNVQESNFSSRGQQKNITCTFWRDLESFTRGQSSIVRGQTINFYAGFKTFTSQSDGRPDASGVSQLISVQIFDSASNLVATMGIVLGSIGCLISNFT